LKKTATDRAFSYRETVSHLHRKTVDCALSCCRLTTNAMSQSAIPGGSVSRVTRSRSCLHGPRDLPMAMLYLCGDEGAVESWSRRARKNMRMAKMSAVEPDACSTSSTQKEQEIEDRHLPNAQPRGQRFLVAPGRVTRQCCTSTDTHPLPSSHNALSLGENLHNAKKELLV
jgi:hypothetical protein